MKQLELSLLELYASNESVENKDVYDALGGTKDGDVKPVGTCGTNHNLFYRKVRWTQQTLKQKGLLKRIGKGCWSITGKGKKSLSEISDNSALIAFSSELGVAIWGSSKQVMQKHISEPIHLCFTSPPYPLKQQRAYGSCWKDEVGYIDFLCETLEPIVAKLVPGGSIVLNVSNDIYVSKKPARSLYLERLILALHDRLDLELMDRHVWRSNKAPSPLYWSSIKRIQLNAQYEPVLWFSNDPINSLASIDRVLEDHSDRHKEFIKSGGIKKPKVYGDGAYRKYKGDYSKPTKGRIPHNCFFIANHCPSGRKVNKYARNLGIPTHGAKMPLKLAEFYIKYLTDKGQTVIDPFAGTLTLGEAAEKNGRHWICIDKIREYIYQGLSRFSDGWRNPEFTI